MKFLLETEFFPNAPVDRLNELIERQIARSAKKKKRGGRSGAAGGGIRRPWPARRHRNF